jgi:hypothetical protein
VTAAVETGGPADWLATAIYLAEQVMVGDHGRITVSIFRENPWGHQTPTQHKTLAKVGFVPDERKWSPDTKWTMAVAQRMPSVIDIETDIVTAELYDPDLRPHPKRPGESPEAAARRLMIQKHSLPSTWKPPADLGTRGVHLQQDQIRVIVPSNINVSRLRSCLSSSGTGRTSCQ